MQYDQTLKVIYIKFHLEQYKAKIWEPLSKFFLNGKGWFEHQRSLKDHIHRYLPKNWASLLNHFAFSFSAEITLLENGGESPKKKQKTSNEVNNEEATQKNQKANQVLQNLVPQFGLIESLLIELTKLIIRRCDVENEKWSKSAISHLMIPRNSVPSEVVVQLLGAFGNFSHNMRQSILKWIILVFDLIDQKEILHKMYAVFFHYLAYETLR